MNRHTLVQDIKRYRYTLFHLHLIRSSETVQKLVDFVLERKAPHATSSLIHGISVLIDILRRGTW
jgi:hypothetical protein